MPCLDVLGLRVRIGDEESSPDPNFRAGRPADLEVSLLGDAPWPAGLLAGAARLSYTDPDTDQNGVPIIRVWEHGQTIYRLRYWDDSEFVVDRAGTRVWARWPPAVPDAEIRLCLLGPIIGFVLHVRGTPCLHASAVAVDGRAVAFLGHSGAGKSTTAASFVRRGYRALTDDVLALDETQGSGIGDRGSGDGHVAGVTLDQDSGFGIRDSGRTAKDSGFGIRDSAVTEVTPHQRPDVTRVTGVTASRFYVRPGHNLVRLWPDAVRALYGSDAALPAGGDTTDKRHLDLAGAGDAFQAEPLPLGAIYVIADRRDDVPSPAQITALKGHEALMALVARTYMNYVLDSTLRVRALTVFARLAAQVPIRQLIVRHDSAALGALTDAILQDLRRR